MFLKKVQVPPFEEKKWNGVGDILWKETCMERRRTCVFKGVDFFQTWWCVCLWVWVQSTECVGWWCVLVGVSAVYRVCGLVCACGCECYRLCRHMSTCVWVVLIVSRVCGCMGACVCVWFGVLIEVSNSAECCWPYCESTSGKKMPSRLCLIAAIFLNCNLFCEDRVLKRHELVGVTSGFYALFCHEP